MLRQQRSELCISLFVTTLLCHLTAALSRPTSLTKDISSLQVNITTLNTSGEWVEVSWSGIRSPSIHDAVALVVPADVDYRETAPAKHKWASESPTHLDTGSGSLKFRLLNHRADMKFIMVTNLTDWLGFFDVVAESQIIRPANPNEPLQGHLARTTALSEMLVQWTTRDMGKPVVRWGTRSGELSSTARATTDTYTRDDMCGGVANSTGYINPGLFHTAKMNDLQPDTRYYYAYGDEENGFSEESSFVTAPPPGSDATVKLLAIADLGFCEEDGSMTWPGNYPNAVAVEPVGSDEEIISEVQNALHMGWVNYCAALITAKRMQEDIDGRTLIVHNGDVSYAEGFVYGWNLFMDMMGPLVQQAPYMLTPGNHERDWPGTGTRFDFPPARDSGGECGVAYGKRFPMPLQGKDKEWYSFDHGPIHFLQFSTEHDFAPGSEQFAWILRDLQTVDRSVTPWVVAGFHRPFYTDSVYGNSDSGDVGFTDAIRAALERLFFQFQVDVTWFGHVHSYSRTCPVFQRNCMGYAPDGSANAPVHMLIGHAGAPYSWTISPETPPYYESVAIQHGYLRVAANRTALQMEAVNSLDGTVVDSHTLTKPAGWRPDQAARLATIALFHSNYTPTWLELSGINGPAEDLVLRPAEALLFSDPDLLHALRNATLVKNPIAFDTIEALDQIFEPINDIFKERLADSATTSEAAKFFYEHYFRDLFALYREHRDGLVKGRPSSFAPPVRVPVEQGF
ncbi:g10243 [Coccomyxa elongata]